MTEILYPSSTFSSRTLFLIIKKKFICNHNEYARFALSRALWEKQNMDNLPYFSGHFQERYKCNAYDADQQFWLERPLRVREARVRSPTASHQRRKNGSLCFSAWRLALMSRHPTVRLGVSINGLSDSFLLTCGGIESVPWHRKIVGRRSFGPNKTGPH